MTLIMRQKLSVKNQILMIDYNKCKKLTPSFQLDCKEGFPHTLSLRLISTSKSDFVKKKQVNSR